MRALTLLIILAALGLTAGCGGHSIAAHDPAFGDPGELTLEQALGVADELNIPSLSTQENSELRETFRQALLASGKTRFISAVPEVAPDDLDVSYNGDGTATLSWTYTNAGDFDQNGEVHAADIAPLAKHFNASESDAAWAEARVVDGDGNGEINASDITRIASNFLNKIDGYELQYSADGESGWEVSAVVPFTESSVPEDGGFRVFAHTFTIADPGYFRLTSKFGSESGGFSSLCSFDPREDMQVQNLQATQGSVTDAVELTWDEMGEVEGFRVERADSAEGEYAELGIATDLNFDDQTVEPGVHYWYRVTALLFDDLESLPSDPAEGWSFDGISELTILPDPDDPDWAGVIGSGTQQDPYICSSEDPLFNREVAGDGNFTIEFSLIARDQHGNFIHGALLTWFAVPPFIAPDVDDSPEGTFRVNQFTNGRIYAQYEGLSSNELWVASTGSAD